MTDVFRETLGNLLKARFPLLCVESFEEHRVLAEIAAVATDPVRVRTSRNLVTWSLTEGLVRPDGTRLEESNRPEHALRQALHTEEATVFVFRDLHPFLGDGQRPGDPAVVRLLRDVCAAFKSGPVARSLVLVSPTLHLPVELEKDVAVVDFPLPRVGEIRALLDDMIRSNIGSGRLTVTLDDAGRDRLATTARGLTLQEAENAFARAMVTGVTLSEADVDAVLEEKRRAVRTAGLLECVRVDIGLYDVGGLENLKQWLVKRQDSWLAEAARYGLPNPRGILITGVPGCGKSLTAKATSAAWGLPAATGDGQGVRRPGGVQRAEHAACAADRRGRRPLRAVAGRGREGVLRSRSRLG